jgi:SAM-dependent methyltransferase
MPQWEPAGEAEKFDDRAGLPPQACEDIAEAVSRIGDLSSGSLLLEIGTGTGQIGERLCQRARYVGFDHSPAMIERFRKRLPSHPEGALLVADGSLEWPVPARSVRLFFSSRAIHLLPAEHVRGQILRAAIPEAVLVLGRVSKDEDSWQTSMRRHLRKLLRERGLVSEEGRDREAALLDALECDGAVRFEPVTVAKWTVEKQPRDLLEDWARKQRLGGMELSHGVKDEVLEGMARWVEEKFPPGSRAPEITARYVLKGVRLRSESASTA